MAPMIEARGVEKRYGRRGAGPHPGPAGRALLGHAASYFVVRALAWTVAILAVALPLAVAPVPPQLTAEVDDDPHGRPGVRAAGAVAAVLDSVTTPRAGRRGRIRRSARRRRAAPPT